MRLPDPQSVVEARGLRKHYGEFTAVDGIDFEIRRGGCFGFLGPNGAGKTTCLRLLLGLTPMSAGRLRVFGLPMPEAARAVRSRVGMVPQADNLDPDFSVVENLQVYASYFGLSRRQVAERIEQLLSFAALGERRDAKTETLSGGMKRRLTLARALINNPEMLILDEPTTGLDPQARHLIWARLSELREGGTTLLLTTHYMEEAERLCDDLLILDRGRILARGAPRDLVAEHVEPEVVEIRGDTGGVLDGEVLAACRSERLGLNLYCYTRDAAPLLGALHKTRGLTFSHRPTGLEDVFLRLTGRELRD
jgi:lipooligosaccharide transport system ATP-binding protein